MTTLRDVMARLDEVDDHMAIYVSPWPRWSPASRCLITEEPEDGSLPEAAQGLTYLLDGAAAKEAVRIWCARHPEVSPTRDALCDAVIYFARHDAHEPALHDAV